MKQERHGTGQVKNGVFTVCGTYLCWTYICECPPPPGVWCCHLTFLPAQFANVRKNTGVSTLFLALGSAEF